MKLGRVLGLIIHYYFGSIFKNCKGCNWYLSDWGYCMRGDPALAKPTRIGPYDLNPIPCKPAGVCKYWQSKILPPFTTIASNGMVRRGL